MEHLNSTLNDGLIKKWNPLLQTGGKIKSASIKGTLARVLENTRQELRRSGVMLTEHAGSPSGYGIAAGADNVGLGLPKLVLPVLRRIFPDLMCHELVGVQAMNGPIGFVIALRARLNGGNGWVGTGGDPSVNEIGFGPIDASYTGTFDTDARVDDTFAGTFPNAFAGDVTTEASSFDARMVGAQTSAFAGVTGTAVGDDSLNYLNTSAAITANPTAPSVQVARGTTLSATNGEDQTAAYTKNFNPTNRILGVGAPNTPAVQFADIVHGTYPTVSFGLERKEVVAKTRKLGAHWSPELAEDMEVMHNIDVETELVNILSYEIGAEIDRQILTEMIKLATLNSIEAIDAESIYGWDQASRVIALLSKVNQIANQIAIDTRRGAGNFVVASPKVCSLLTMLGVSKFTANGETMPSVPASAVGALQKVGLINDGQQLLIRDTFARVDYFMVGYKGTHPGDAGIIYAPYIPVQLSKVMRPDTFTPQLAARTRYGIVANPLDARFYYKLVLISNIDSMFMGANNQVQ